AGQWAPARPHVEDADRGVAGMGDAIDQPVELDLSLGRLRFLARDPLAHVPGRVPVMATCALDAGRRSERFCVAVQARLLGLALTRCYRLAGPDGAVRQVRSPHTHQEAVPCRSRSSP